MKIVAINGSHRGKRGYTQFLINKLFEGSVKEGAECETIVLAEHKINECTGCRVCHTQKHYLKCIYHDKDDVSAIFDKLRSADMITFATPIYIFTMTGKMKVFLDRITSTGDSSIPVISEKGLFFHNTEKKLFAKPFAIITCQDNFEHETCKNVISYFETFSRFMDAPFVGALNAKSGGLVKHGQDVKKEEEFPKIKQVYAAYIKAGEELVKNGKISKLTQQQANQNIIEMPKVAEFLLGFKFIRSNKNIMNKFFAQAKAHIEQNR